MPDIISRNLSTGPNIAESGAMAENNRVPILKEYPRPNFETKPTKADVRRAERVELRYLRDRIKQQNDQIRRLRQEIQSEIAMLTAALEENQQETYDQVKRRISRLKGSLEYKGRTDYTLTER